MRSRSSLLLPLAAALLCAGGCNNPFDPKADVELAGLTTRDASNGDDRPEITILPSQIPGGGAALTLTLWTVTAQFIVRNRVGVAINSVDIVYTDLDGNEVTAYKTTGGRHYKLATRLDPVSGNGSSDGGEGLFSNIFLYVVDRNVITELQSPSYPSNHYMFADITFRGEDDNGHDIRMSGRMTIKYFQ